MILNTKYKLRTLGQERLMVLDAPDGSANMTVMLKFNSVAAMLWEIAGQAPFTEESLMDALKVRFTGADVTTGQMQRDVSQLLDTWKKYNLVIE